MQQYIETFGKINGNEVYENRDCKIMTIFIFQHSLNSLWRMDGNDDPIRDKEIKNRKSTVYI